MQQAYVNAYLHSTSSRSGHFGTLTRSLSTKLAPPARRARGRRSPPSKT
jgi:hypothetical protein